MLQNHRDDFLNVPISDLRSRVVSGELTVTALVQGYLGRIQTSDAEVRAFLAVTEDRALASAADADRRIASGEPLGPLTGAVIALKDNLCVEGVVTTAGSRILERYIPPYTATVVTRLQSAGAIVIGKTNLDEFAMGSSTEHSAFGPTRNPWDLERVPGGSSGGSAAACAAAMCSGALGSDTGGSIRQPAAFCGVVGLKPTYGRVSRSGLIAFASSLDQIGPFGHDVRDCAELLQTIAGHDPLDSTSSTMPVPEYAESCGTSVAGLRIGLPVEFFGDGISPTCAAAAREAAAALQSMGARVEECSLPATAWGLSAYYVIAPAEASSNLARFDGIRYGLRVSGSGHIGLMEATRGTGFGAEVQQRIMAGTWCLSSGYYDQYYRRAQQVRTLIRGDFDVAFERFDVLLSPTTPTTAFRFGDCADPLQMKLGDVCTLPANLAGICAISIPAGLVDGLPAGVQLMARAFDEEMLFRVGSAYEQVRGALQPPRVGASAEWMAA
ncbi:MAG: Asp-tRNA(Asn)/Glu-tRNA(Gln) amidotransferase subunit GatA [Armatimonadetes bacterium]|nr:Asp-tRNA(Asn)/Glu-tRNA(Gln) amidotransferase subunit GatA [Armatimonadota bacterium]MDE2206804.1 Asp-tRNA(Asn)/Glu-tRNA(Gln) amidotransferase subunit GatA [Armatimonadota bacterium]